MALHRRHRTAVAMTDAEKADAEKAANGHAPATVNARARAPRPWRVALSLFTVIPADVPGAIRRDMAAKALPWLPAVGAMVAAIAAGAMFAVQAGGAVAGGAGRA